MESGRQQLRTVFLDRDGTINVEKDYLYLPEDFELIPGAAQAIRMLHEAGFLVVVVTNQSGIGRGYYDEDALVRLHRHMDDLLSREGARVDAYYFCPHHPEAGEGGYRIDCDCRKPLPGMLFRAAADLNIDLASSYIIGDKMADVEAGLRAGCRSILVETGYGATEKEKLSQDTPTFATILEAARWIIDSEIMPG
jgi:D-glycero-D-manno-heptose 1,7-bisphosphate phosphatase